MKRNTWRSRLTAGCSVFLLALTASALQGAAQGASIPISNNARLATGDPSQPALRSDIDGEIPATVQLGTNGSESLPDEIEKSAPEDRVGGTRTGILEHLQAALILEYATYLIAVVTAVFAIFLAGFGFFEWARFKDLRNELANEKVTLGQRVESFERDLGAQRKEVAEERAKEKMALGERIESFKSDLETQRKELADERHSLEARVETFKSELEMQEQRLAANQRFLEAVLSHHSNLLVGIVEGFGTALKPKEARRLGLLILEADAALDLFYPNRDDVFRSLLRLEEVGSQGSISSLKQLRDDKEADPEIRIRAQQVLSKILERLKKERQGPPAPPPGSGVIPPPAEPPSGTHGSGAPGQGTARQT